MYILKFVPLISSCGHKQSTVCEILFLSKAIKLAFKRTNYRKIMRRVAAVKHFIIIT